MPWEGPTMNDQDRLRAIERRLEDVESERVRSAILAERERCALIAENWKPNQQPSTAGYVPALRAAQVFGEIAAAIRKGEA